jgi:hypothetical protein
VLPEGNPIAAVVLVHGAGPKQRMMSLARISASDRFAVLPYDKPGVGKSGGQYWGIIDPEGVAALNLLADDAVAAAEACQNLLVLKEFRPIAAIRFPTTKFIASRSGPVCTVSEQLHFQFWAMNDQDFWKTHMKEQVADYMKSAPYRADDIDAKLFWSLRQTLTFRFTSGI